MSTIINIKIKSIVKMVIDMTKVVILIPSVTAYTHMIGMGGNLMSNKLGLISRFIAPCGIYLNRIKHSFQ